MRVVFSSLPVSSHIAPLLPLAVAAREAGDEVAFATGPDALDQIATAGVEAIEAGLPFAETWGATAPQRRRRGSPG
jgi:UDP:flavonoid glycosyltransferase YjiC (YdhE family)